MTCIEHPSLWRDGCLQARTKSGSLTQILAAQAVRSRLEQLGAMDQKQEAGAGENERQEAKPEFGDLRGTMPRRLVHASMNQRRSAGTHKQHNTKQPWWELSHGPCCLSASDRRQGLGVPRFDADFRPKSRRKSMFIHAAPLRRNAGPLVPMRSGPAAFLRSHGRSSHHLCHGRPRAWRVPR